MKTGTPILLNCSAITGAYSLARARGAGDKTVPVGHSRQDPDLVLAFCYEQWFCFLVPWSSVEQP